MPPGANLAAFVLAAAVLIAGPGPSVLFVIGRSLSSGRRVGLLTVLGNAMGMLPQFTAPATGSVWSQILVLGTVHLLIGLAFDTVWALTAGAARGWLTRDPRRLPRLGATGGVMMIGVGATIALSDRQL